MATPTLTYLDAWEAARFSYTRSVDGAQQERANNLAVSKMWRAYDWHGTVIKLPPFWLVPNQTDYGPTIAVPNDFLGFREVYHVHVNGTSPTYNPVKVVRNLERSGLDAYHPGGYHGNATDEFTIAYKSESGIFRIHPRPGGGWAAPDHLITGTYKKQPFKILRSQFAQTIPFEDTYFDAFVSACVWAALYLGGQRDEAVKQEFLFKGLLQDLTTEVAREDGMDWVHPAESIMESY